MNFIITMSNLLSTNVVVSILVSVYKVHNHKHGVDYTTIIVHYTERVHTTCYTLQTTLPNGPFSHSRSQFY